MKLLPTAPFVHLLRFPSHRSEGIDLVLALISLDGLFTGRSIGVLLGLLGLGSVISSSTVVVLVRL